MRDIANPFILPKFTIIETDNDDRTGKFVIEPLERGFGQTLGNSLRRILLSSLPGASMFALKVEGALHEFSALDGVVEDVTTIVLNLKNLILKIDDQTEAVKRLELNVKGPAVATAGDLVLPYDVHVINKDLVIANVSEGGELHLTVFARNGRGYVTGEANKANRDILGSIVGTIATDSNYSPIRKVGYTVENTRVGHDERYDRLILEVETNGSVKATDAVSLAARIMIEHLNPFLDLDKKAEELNIMKEDVVVEEEKFKDTQIEDLEISVRSYNCLKRAGINTLSELVSKSEEEILKVKNLGKKSFKEIKDTLAARGLSFRGSID
jgi:DNA-directed RNA polymerase subunit alpha